MQTTLVFAIMLKQYHPFNHGIKQLWKCRQKKNTRNRPNISFHVADEHNKLRSKIALGQQAGQPAAANMNQVVGKKSAFWSWNLYQKKSETILSNLFFFPVDSEVDSVVFYFFS